jgi:hypothetical protein
VFPWLPTRILPKRCDVVASVVGNHGASQSVLWKIEGYSRHFGDV